MPPEIERSWDLNNSWGRAKLLAYEEIREHEEFEVISFGLQKKAI